MRKVPFPLASLLLSASLAAADGKAKPAPAPIPAVVAPTGPLATPGATIFEDDLSGAKSNAWRFSIPAFAWSNGVLMSWQQRKDHGSVGTTALKFSNAVVAVDFRFEGATIWHLVFNDKTWKESHAGHVCRVSLASNLIRLVDDKEGGMKLTIQELKKDPSKKEEVAKLLVGRSLTAPAALRAGEWHRLTCELVGAEMRVHLDGEPVASLVSPGFAHGQKGDFAFAVSGGTMAFRNLSIRKAE